MYIVASDSEEERNLVAFYAENERLIREQSPLFREILIQQNILLPSSSPSRRPPQPSASGSGLMPSSLSTSVSTRQKPQPEDAMAVDSSASDSEIEFVSSGKSAATGTKRGPAAKDKEAGTSKRLGKRLSRGSSSEDAESEVEAERKRARKSSPKGKGKASKATAVKKGKGKQKAAPVIQQFLLADNPLRVRWGNTLTLSAAFDLVAPSLEQPIDPNLKPAITSLFKGLKICLVNGTVPNKPNTNDKIVTMALAIIIQQGAELLPPERWGEATHIVSYEPSHKKPQRRPDFKQVLELLVPPQQPGSKAKAKDGSSMAPTEADLDGIEVVKFEWVQESVKTNRQADETMYSLKVPYVASPHMSKARRKASEAAFAEYEARKRREASHSPELDRAEEPDEDGGWLSRPVSPFGEDDVPEEDKLLRPLLMLQLKEGTSDLCRPPALKAHSSTVAKNVDPAATSASADASSAPTFEGFDDLPMQAALDEMEKENIMSAEKRYGIDSATADLMVFNTAADDNLTSDEERERKAGPSSSKDKGSKKKVTPRKKSSYACDTAGQAVEKGPNHWIAEQLSALADEAKKNDPGNQWRERGYRMAAGILRNVQVPIRTYAAARELRGIGDSVATKIVEIVKTGGHRRLRASPEDEALSILNGIYGVGGKTAREWLEEYDIRTVQDVLDGKNGLRPTPAQMYGALNYDDLQERIPRAEVEEIGRVIKEAAREIDPELIVEVMGSYRRGAKDSGDVDILVTRPIGKNGKDHAGAVDALIKKLEKKGIISICLTAPDEPMALDAKWMGCVILPDKEKWGGRIRRLDVLGVPFNELPAALIYFTGNDFFNRSLRLKARHNGYSLNQHALSKNVFRGKGGLKETEGTRVHVESEQDIFRILGVKWRPPHMRIPC